MKRTEPKTAQQQNDELYASVSYAPIKHSQSIVHWETLAGFHQLAGEFALDDRAAKAVVTGAAAKTVLNATNTWWLGLAVSVGSRWLASYGGNKRQRYEALERAVESLERSASRDGALALVRS